MYTCILYIYICISYLQVLSECVSKALTLTGGPEVEGTATFTQMFDKFFDIMNVTNFDNGKKQRKAFKNRYISGDDFRLKVN